MTYEKENPGAAATASEALNFNKYGIFIEYNITSFSNKTQGKSSFNRLVIQEGIVSKVEANYD